MQGAALNSRIRIPLIVAALVASMLTLAGPASSEVAAWNGALNHALGANESVGTWTEVAPGTIVYSVRSDGQRAGLWRTDFAGNAVQLSDISGAVNYPPNHSHAVFVADPNDDRDWELYSVAVDGSGTELLVSGIGSNEDILSDRGSIAFAADSSAVIYQKRDSGGDYALWSVSIQGGTPSRLSRSGPAYGNTSSAFEVTPDGAHLIYSIYFEAGGGETYRVPVGGGQSIKLTNVPFFYGVSPDSQHLIFRTTDRLRARRIAGSGAVNLSGSISAAVIGRIEISPDSGFVVYSIKSGHHYDLYGTPMTGGTGNKLTPAMDSDIGSFSIAGDGSKVLYVAMAAQRDGDELYLVDPDGGNRTRLVAVTTKGHDIASASFSPDTTRVIYSYVGIPESSLSYARLYSIPVGGGTAVELSGDLISKSGFRYWSDGADRIVYVGYADPIAGTGHEAPRRIFTTSLTTGGPTLISRHTAGDAGANFGRVALDGTTVIYHAEAFANDRTELFLAPLTPPLCDGKVPTIAGSRFADTITGTSGPDVIVGLAGNDTIAGKGGRDTICGGTGSDTIRGGKGYDRLFGDAGRDTIWGAKGRDLIKGGNGVDVIFGGPHADWLYGGSNADTIHGDGGADRVRGDNGADTLTGGADNDRIWGKRGSDDLDGGLGDDTCNGGPDTDTAADCETIVDVP
ncbi:MAG: hypothetical protein GY720_04775 [bacterium]|nr:hypothetical protein [bacterium]